MLSVTKSLLVFFFPVVPFVDFSLVFELMSIVKKKFLASVLSYVVMFWGCCDLKQNIAKFFISIRG